MNETVILVLAGGAGVLLGAFFFGGLWWTVRRGLSSKRPAFWFLGSLLLRVIGTGCWRVSSDLSLHALS
jgi:F1F0 ATPase subunit 2